MASRSEGPLGAWRVADRRHKLFAGTGALLYGARWNSPGRPVIYAAETYAGALLEILVHASGRLPRRQSYIRILAPAGVAVEVVGPEDVPGWDAADLVASRRFGDRWYDEGRTAILLVPSVVTRVERNILFHPGHPEFAGIHTEAPQPVRWDARLLRGAGPP